jgi:carbon monoxide dehydrogenase subunit G
MGKQTRMHYHGHVHFGGRMASTGQRILEIATKAMMQQSFESLNGYFMAQTRAQLFG